MVARAGQRGMEQKGEGNAPAPAAPPAQGSASA